MSKYALVTGANRGIGLEVVKQLVSHGKPVLLACRDVQKGEQYSCRHHCDERIQTSTVSSESSALHVLVWQILLWHKLNNK